MPRIDVSGYTRDVVSPAKGHMVWGRWTVLIEGGFNERPEESFDEALRRVRGLIENTSNAESISIYGQINEEGLSSDF